MPKISPKLKPFVVVLFLSGTLAAADQPELLRLEESGDAMGATYSIVLYGYDRVKMEAAVDAAFEEVRRLDEMLSNYRADSEWSEVNRHASRCRLSCSGCSRIAWHTAARAKGLSIFRWAR
jgi:thiamine biosynthesis lipoprotein ApbE